MKAQDRLVRQWTILSAVSRVRGGVESAELASLTSQSRANLYRDLRVLEEAGIPIMKERGRVRLLTEKELPPLGFSAMQIASFRLARLQLEPIAGAGIVRELDELLAKLDTQQAQGIFSFAVSDKPVPAPNILKTLERAQRYKKRAAIEYRSLSRGGAAKVVHIEPLVVRVADGDPYVLAYSVEHQAERTFKLARISSASLTEERATHKPSASPVQTFAHAIKAWAGSAQKIRVRLDAAVAWLAREYPLPGQSETKNADGSVTIHAAVAGLVEAQRRILAWGSSAEVLEPPELRESTRAELARALQKYEGPKPGKSPKLAKGKSTRAGARAIKHGETRVG